MITIPAQEFVSSISNNVLEDFFIIYQDAWIHFGQAMRPDSIKFHKLLIDEMIQRRLR